MYIHLRRIFVVKFSDVLTCPDIPHTHALGTRHFEGRKTHVHCLGGVIEVRKTDSDATITQVPHPCGGWGGNAWANGLADRVHGVADYIGSIAAFELAAASFTHPHRVVVETTETLAQGAVVLR